MQSPTPRKPVTARAVRQRIDALQREVSDITPLKVMANPMAIQNTALRTCALLGDLLTLIEPCLPYLDEEIPANSLISN